MVTLKRVKIFEKCKNHSEQVKITSKTSENHSKKRGRFLKKEWKSLQKSDFH